MKTLESYIMEAGLDKDLLYDVLISVVENNRTIYERCNALASSIAKKAKRGERPDFNKLTESSAIDKLAAETFKIYVAEYSSPGMRLGTQEHKELKKWLAARVFHILEDELEGLTDEEIKEFENNPYYSTSDFDQTLKEAWVPLIMPGLYDFCWKLSALLDKVPVDPLFDIFGETYEDQPRTPKSFLRGGSGCYSEDAKLADVDGYLCYDNRGDYVSFTHKPTNAQLEKARVYIEKEIVKLLGPDKKLYDKYNTELTVYVRGYNSYYQPRGTYGIGTIFKFGPKKQK